MAAKLFFLIGSPRSGTTLLGAMLGANPKVAVTQETHFVPVFWNKRHADGDLSDDLAWNRLIERFLASRAFIDMRMDEAEYRAAAQRIPRTHVALFELLVMQFAAREGVALVGEKTPSHATHIATLEQLFPGSQYVEIQRDPWATVASLRKVPWGLGSARADADTWRRHVAAVRRAAPGLGDRLLSVRYRELVETPEVVLRRVCDFLGVDFHPAMLDHASHRRWLHQPGVEWVVRLQRPVNTDSVDRWRSELSESDVADLETVCYFEMRRLGFTPVTKVSTLIPAVVAALLRQGAARAIRILGRVRRRLTGVPSGSRA